MNRLTTLEDLFMEEIKDLYHAENQLVKALPKIAKKVSSTRLRDAIARHLEETRMHVSRLEETFAKLGKPIKSKRCKAMHGLLAEGNEMLSATAEPSVKDAGIIANAQRVEHYEIAGYGCLRTYATLLGRPDIAELMTRTLQEEKNADETLTALAENEINPEATVAVR